MSIVVSLVVEDVRFPTSADAAGSDAMNPDADYSAAYVRLGTDSAELFGCGFTFTIGRGNDICVAAIRAVAERLVGRTVAALCDRPGEVYRELTSDSHLRWLGPEKGIIHLAIGAVMNAVWDLAARRAGVPLWRLVAEMSPEQILDAADLRYLSDVLTEQQVLDLLRAQEPGRQQRVADLEARGYPCYTTSPGWLGYSDEKLERLCREAVADGYRHVKLKVGLDAADDVRRLGIARRAVGPDVSLMIDSNQVWEVDEAIERIRALDGFGLVWAEEPTSPDDILGHARIREAIAPLGIGVATGEHGMNRVLFKQMLQAGAIDYLQLDACRLASVNEVLAVQLLAARFGVPVCPHAGGVGLCELVNHLAAIDYVVVSGRRDDRVAEYVDHLHEHFVDPCRVRDGAYVLPHAPGYSAEMVPEAIETYRWPDGAYWAAQRPVRSVS